MDKVIYINKNLQTREVEIFADGEDFVTLVEDCFIICVIYGNEVLKPFLEDLTALERYAMASNGFDFLSLQDKDFRNANTIFRISSDDLNKLEKDKSGSAPAPLKIDIPAMVPVYSSTENYNQILRIVSAGDEFATLLVDGQGYDMQRYRNSNNQYFEVGKVAQIGGLFLCMSAPFPDSYGMHINPVRNEYNFEHSSNWVQLHELDSPQWDLNSAYSVLWKYRSQEIYVLISTTPLFDWQLANYHIGGK